MNAAVNPKSQVPDKRPSDDKRREREPKPPQQIDLEPRWWALVDAATD